MPGIGYFALGILLLLLGGDSMAKGVSGLAQRLGLPPFLAGVLLLGVALSLPDLVVTIYAWHSGLGELALGNALGNSVASLGLVLGVALLIAPLALRMRWQATARMLLLAAAGMLLLLGRDGRLERWEGGILVLSFIATLGLAFWRGRREDSAVRQELSDFAQTRTGLGQNLSRLAIAGAVLFFAGKFLLHSAPGLGQALGLTPLQTGLLLLGIATAVPDLFVAAMAARQGQGDVVLGQALGSGLVNLLLAVGSLAVAQPLSLPAALALPTLPALMAMLLLLPLLLRSQEPAGRRAGGLLLGAFGLWLALVLAWP